MYIAFITLFQSSIGYVLQYLMLMLITLFNCDHLVNVSFFSVITAVRNESACF